MSVIKQPFQMIPFSKTIESQWRLREDCYNDLCDIPIIPQGKFVPFGIITNSDNVGSLVLHCWDEPFSYTRTENFTKNDCDPGENGSVVPYSKVYFSTISSQDAQNKALSDNNYLIEGQNYSNIHGVCNLVALFLDNFDNWAGSPALPFPEGKGISWSITPNPALTFSNDLNRLNLGMTSDVGFLSLGLRYINAVAFGLYAKIKVTIKVDELSEANSFRFVIFDVSGPTSSTILSNGMNEFVLTRGIHYMSGWECIALNSYPYPGTTYPRHIIIDYLKIEVYVDPPIE